VNIKEIKEMINLMNENGLAELEIEKDNMRIKLKKTASGTEVFSGPLIPEVPRPAAEILNQKAAEQTQQTTAQNSVEIRAPMVGTFYRAPAPETPPFVEAGQVIEPGQVICIIEAMKLMNEIKSEIKGRVSEILVDNAEPVEFGQPMFLIEPL